MNPRPFFRCGSLRQRPFGGPETSLFSAKRGIDLRGMLKNAEFSEGLARARRGRPHTLPERSDPASCAGSSTPPRTRRSRKRFHRRKRTRHARTRSGGRRRGITSHNEPLSCDAIRPRRGRNLSPPSPGGCTLCRCEAWLSYAAPDTGFPDEMSACPARGRWRSVKLSPAASRSKAAAWWRATP